MKDNHLEEWTPPFSLYVAGRGTTSERTYRNDVSTNIGPSRLLLKRTLSGEGVLYVSGRKHILHQGDLFIIERPGPYLYCYEGDGKPWKFEYVSMAHNMKQSVLPESLRENPVCSIAKDSTFDRQLSEVIESRMRDDYHPELRHSMMAYQLLLTYVAMRMESPRAHSHASQKLRSLLIERHAEEVSINKLARDLGYTQEALTRRFQCEYGIPPGRFLLEFRLNKARRLLLESSLSVKEIAFECAFNSHNYFSRAFKRKFRTSPSAYRANPNIFE